MNKGQFLVYETENGQFKIDVRLQDETLWLKQKAMAELFQASVPNINIHLKNILIVQFEGGRQEKRT